MKENQHNDNLERFFKANLERYSPTPSDDFWARMEPVIPVKPSFWSTWNNALGRWAGLGLLVAAVVAVLWLWHRDRDQLARLSKTVKSQQEQLEQLDGLGKKADPATRSKPSFEAQTSSAGTPKRPTGSEPQAANDGEVFIQKNTASMPKNAATIFLPTSKNEAVVKNQPTKLNGFVAAQTIENQSIENQVGQMPLSLETVATSEAATNLDSESLSKATAPNFLAVKYSPIISTPKNPQLSVRFLSNRPQNPYPRFSFELGATAFRLPLGRLFQQDTFLSGRTGMSFGAGLLVNYELNTRTTVQAGYQFKNIRARRLELRYNSFPLSVQRRWASGHKVYLEGKTGFSLNSLVSARTDSDGQSVKGLQTTWVGLHGGLAAAIQFNEKLSLVTGPNLGWSLTPMTAGRRSWEMGAGVSLRYQL